MTCQFHVDEQFVDGERGSLLFACQDGCQTLPHVHLEVGDEILQVLFDLPDNFLPKLFNGKVVFAGRDFL